MAQASRTTCAHNATDQVVRGSVPVPCRKCGAMIQATPRAVSGGTHRHSDMQVNATYPGDAVTADQTWAFAQ